MHSAAKWNNADIVELLLHAGKHKGVAREKLVGGGAES